MAFTIYCLTFRNGKRYIGRTARPLLKRLTAHRTGAYKSQHAVHKAWCKFGDPAVRVLSVVAGTKAANAAEAAAVDRYGTTDPRYGYNERRGGGGPPGKRPASVGRKISLSWGGTRHTAESRAKMRRARIALWASKTYRTKQMAFRTDPVYRAKLRRILKLAAKKRHHG